MLSVNQLNAKIKIQEIQEIWKSKNINGYPLKIQNLTVNQNTVNTRAMTENKPIEIGGSTLIEKTCVSDAIKLWNVTPNDIKMCQSLKQLKTLTRKFVKTLPV